MTGVSMKSDIRVDRKSVFLLLCTLSGIGTRRCKSSHFSQSAKREKSLKAIISDIHSNLEALQAVLADVKRRGIREIICLGDIVGYGPNPKECIDIVSDLGPCTMGNHDEATLFESEADYFNYRARAAIDWTREQLEDVRESEKNGLRWTFLGELPRQIKENGVLFVHGSPRNPVKEYIFPEDVVYNPEKMANVFSRFEGVAFIGHTHIPGVFTEDQLYFSPEEIQGAYTITGKKALINVGSVGQPRDGIADASYAIFDGRKVEFCRVPYDYRRTMRKIYDIPALDKDLADRLAEGR